MKVRPWFNQNYQFTQVLRRKLQLDQQCQSLQKLLPVRGPKKLVTRVRLSSKQSSRLIQTQLVLKARKSPATRVNP